MFTAMCCKVTEAADAATEVITDTAAKTHDAIKAKANEFTLQRLKNGIEGKNQKIWEAPDIFVTFLNLEIQDGVGAQDPLNFHLKGLSMTAKVEIVGTAPQLTGMAAAMGTAKVFDKVSAGESAVAEKIGLPNLGIGGFVARAADKARDGLKGAAGDGTEVKGSDFHLLVDVQKTLGLEDVKATVKITDTDNPLAKYMSNGTLQKYFEEAISRNMTEHCTKWQNDSIEKTKESIAKKAEEVKAKATEAGSAIAKKAGAS